VLHHVLHDVVKEHCREDRFNVLVLAGLICIGNHRVLQYIIPWFSHTHQYLHHLVFRLMTGPTAGKQATDAGVDDTPTIWF
jgi:hypothetical protein